MPAVVLQSGKASLTSRHGSMFLLIDNWDDWFTYSTMYTLIVYDAEGTEFVKSNGGGRIDNAPRSVLSWR